MQVRGFSETVGNKGFSETRMQHGGAAHAGGEAVEAQALHVYPERLWGAASLGKVRGSRIVLVWAGVCHARGLARFDLYEGSGQKLSPRTMRESLSRGTIKAHEASPEKETRNGASCRLANGTASYRTTNRGTVQSVILVIGATGNVGRHIVSQLLGTGAAVRALTHNPESAGLPGGVDVVRGDLSVSETLDA